MIDEEVRKIVDEAYERTLALLEEKKPVVEKLTQALLEKEVLNVDDLTEILGERPFKNDSLRNIDRFRGAAGADSLLAEPGKDGAEKAEAEAAPGSEAEEGGKVAGEAQEKAHGDEGGGGAKK